MGVLKGGYLVLWVPMFLGGEFALHADCGEFDPRGIHNLAKKV